MKKKISEMPIVKVYGTAVYVTDVVYSNKSTTITKPMVLGKILNSKVILLI